MKKKLLIIKKFGGTSLSNIGKIKKAALLIKKEILLGNKVVVVVSAIGKTTDKLQSLINTFIWRTSLFWFNGYCFE